MTTLSLAQTLSERTTSADDAKAVTIYSTAPLRFPLRDTAGMMSPKWTR